eukprot:SAG22_NODE_7787_length_708_cov_2.305419_1_plen_163_part_01
MPPAPSGSRRLLRALPAAAGLFALAYMVCLACSRGGGSALVILLPPQRDMSWPYCVTGASGQALLVTLANGGWSALWVAAGTYGLIALTEYPPARARSTAAVALAEAVAAVAVVGFARTPLFQFDFDLQLTWAWWAGLAIGVPAAAAGGRLLATQGRLDLGRC